MRNRADDHLSSRKRRVIKAFEDYGMAELSRLTIDEERDLLVIRGKVNSYYPKQVAESLMHELRDVGPYILEIKVRQIQNSIDLL